jgi:glucosamine--fructose-6-phosphate aminotransferase (isomerizing)
MNALSHTEREIRSQPDVWRQVLGGLDTTAIASVWTQRAPRKVLVTGCGSTYFLSMTAAALIRDALGTSARATPASELALGPAPVDPDGTLLLCFSRSGTTSETLAAVERFRRIRGNGVVVITNYPGSALAEVADLVLAAPDGQEVSVAQTRSFSSMLLVAESAIAAITGAALEPLLRLPELASDLMNRSRQLITQLAEDQTLQRFVYLGSDSLYGIAAEGMLKVMEMSLTDAMVFSTLEFRHGPMSLAAAGTAIVGLISAERAAEERAVVSEAAALGARAVEIGPRVELDIPDGLPVWARPALYLPPLQLLALERARAKGLNPDRPRNLSQVIELPGIASREQAS